MFADGPQLYLCVADSEDSALFTFTNQREETVLTLDSFFPPAYKVEYFHNSFGNYLLLVDSQHLSTSYILKDGNFIKMQENLSLGRHDTFWQGVGLPQPGSLLAEQEIVLVKEGTSLHFLHFTAPGLVEVSRSLQLPSVDGLAVPFGFERVERVHPHGDDSNNYIYAVGAIVPEHNPSEAILNFYTEQELAEGMSNLEVFQIDISIAKTNFYSHIDDLSNSVGQLENRILEIESLGAALAQNETFDDLIPLDSDFSESVSLETNSVVFTGAFSRLFNVNVDVASNSDVSNLSFASLDYNKPDSLISRLEDKSEETHEDYIYKYSVFKSSSAPVSLMAGASISVPSAVVHRATVDTLDTVSLNGHRMAPFLTDTLKTNTGTTFEQEVLFQEPVTVSHTTTFVNQTAGSSAIPLQPHKMLDTAKTNILSVPVTFENLRVEDQMEVSGTINGISLSDLVLSSDSQRNISGVKTFLGGLTAQSKVAVEGTINGQAAEEYLASKFLYRFDPNDETNADFTQIINVDKLYFNEIRVKNDLRVDRMGSDELVDVSSSELDRIVVNNEDGSLSGDFKFMKPVNIKNLISSSINEKDPADIVIDGVDQTLNYPFHIRRLVTNNLNTESLNGINLSEDVARTDVANTFTVPVVFTELGVESELTVSEGKCVAGSDVSSWTATAQQYSGVLTITESLVIDQDDITVGLMDFGTFTDQNITKEIFENKFLYKDTTQTLPNLETVGPDTTLFFEDLCLRSTLDGLDMKSGVIHSGNEAETSNIDVFFTGGLTEFQEDVLIYNDDGGLKSHPQIGSHNIKSMGEQIFCGPAGRVTFDGVKTLKSKSPSSDDTELISYYDVTVEGDLTINGRTFVDNGNLQVVKLLNNNEFKEKNTFSSASSGPDVTVSQNLAVSRAVTSNTEESVLLNGRNIKQFDENIVKKTGAFHIRTPVSMGVSITGGKSATITDGGDIDGTDIFTYLDDRVLLDEASRIDVDLSATSLTFKAGLTVTPELEDDSYFAGRDLVDYSASLFDSSDSVLTGALTLTGELNVSGDLIFPPDVLPFNVNLRDLNSSGLSRSREQTIELHYTIGTISRVARLVTNTVAGVELADICLLDEPCTITCRAGADPCVAFTEKVSVTGGTTFADFNLTDIVAALETNNNNYNLELLEISEPGANLDWTHDGEGEATVSHLYRNLVVRSDRDWGSSDLEAEVRQEISGDVTFHGRPEFMDMRTSSGKVNDNTLAEVRHFELFFL